MNVVVGKAYRNRTPIFTAEMTHVIFDPYWNVPLRIQRDELIPAIMRDPSYLRKHPQTALFSRARRDFSHGCIRVERPEDLAVWVLRHNAEWPSTRIRDMLKGSKQTRVELTRHIPVLIVYATAVVLRNDQVRFFEDIYGHDAKLEQRLALVYRSTS